MHYHYYPFKLSESLFDCVLHSRHAIYCMYAINQLGIFYSVTPQHYRMIVGMKVITEQLGH